MNLAKQDRAGTRQPADVERRYKLGVIEPTAEEVEKLKQERVVDSALSTTSTNPVQNKVITNALNNKVSRETGKGLSTNDFTDEYKEKIDTSSTKSHTHNNKSVLDKITQILIDDSHYHDNKDVLDNISQSDINNWNSSIGGDSSAVYLMYYTDYAGYVWFNDGLLIQWGRTSVTPTAINTDTTARITYTYSYDNIPDRKTEVSSATPNVAKVTSGGGTTTTLSKQGMNIYVNSTTTRAVTVDWLATGIKKI